MANESENTANVDKKGEKEMNAMNDIVEKAKSEMKFLRWKSIVLWVMFLAVFCALGTYCFYISPHVTEKNVKFQGSCIATSDSSMSHCASAQASANSVNPSTKHEDPSSKFNVSRRAEVNGCASCRTSSFKFSLFLAIGGFALLFVVICGSIISTDHSYQEMMKLYVTARHRQDVWEKGLELLGCCKDTVNQKLLNENQMKQANPTGFNKPVLAICTDYKVIEALLENLSDDPSKRMFM